MEMKLDSTSGNPSSISVLLLSVNHWLRDEGRDAHSTHHVKGSHFLLYTLHISLLQGVRGQFVFEVEYFIFRIVFQAEGRLHYKPWCIGRRMIMQIIVTVLSSSQNLLADMMLEAAAAAPRSENTPLAIV